MILKNTRKLKNTNIWIDEDYPKEIQEVRRRLIPEMKEARSKGYRAQIRYDKLILNKETHRANHSGQEETSRTGSNSHKRTINERSPEGSKFEDQLRKISRTDPKNY
jgi:hypothetical protein